MARKSKKGQNPKHTALMTEKNLRPIVNATFGAVGEEYFHLLVRHLAALLRVKWVFVSKLVNSNKKNVCLLSMWTGNSYAEPFEYSTKDTPCEKVIGKGIAFYPSHIQKLFPKDRWLIEAGVESYFAIPLFSSSKEPLGHLGVMHDQPLLARINYETILKIFAARSSTELERMNIQNKLLTTNTSLEHALKHLRHLSRHNMKAIETEQKKIVRELHDNIGPAVNGIKMRLEAFVRNPNNNQVRNSEVEKSISLLRSVSQEIRLLSKKMLPQVLDKLGLFAAMKSLVREFQQRTGIQVYITIQMAKEPLPVEKQIHVYRIMQEALNNVEKHSQAKNAFVGVKKRGNDFLLTIEDDGVGIRDHSILDRKNHFKGLGFTSICERAYLLGGEAEIVSKNRSGLLISVEVPFRRRNKPA